MTDKEICASCKHLKKGICPDWFEDCKLRKIYEKQLKRNRV